MDYRNTFIYRAMTAILWVIAVALFAHLVVRGGEAGTCLLRGGKMQQVPNPTWGQVLTLNILTCKERR